MKMDTTQQNQFEQRFYELHPHTLLRFEVHVAEHCNLNCRDCLHFSPLAEKKFLDVDEYRKDCARLSELFDAEAERIYLLGGEPLLHPNLVEIMKITREAFRFGEIGIITNGILLPTMDESFWAACKKYKIEVRPTKYPIRVDYSIVEERVKKTNVLYQPQVDNMPRMLRTPITLKGNQPVERNYYRCNHSNNCLTLRNGRLYTCEIAAHAHHIKKYFDLDLSLSKRDSVDIYAAESADEIMSKLTKPIPFCRYCRLDSRDFWEDWAISQKDRYEWIRFEWTEDDMKYLRSANCVYVYGAGMWGQRAVSRLQENDISVKAVLVSNLDGNPKSVLGVPVVVADDMGHVECDSVCLLAASSSAETELERNIYKHGIKRVIWLSDFKFSYENLQELQSAPEVYIYGAGHRSRETILRLKESGISVKTIVVTNRGNNPDTVMGITVTAIQDIGSVLEGSVCLVAIDNYSAKSEMQHKAYQCGFKHLIPLFEV